MKQLIYCLPALGLFLGGCSESETPSAPPAATVETPAPSNPPPAAAAPAALTGLTAQRVKDLTAVRDALDRYKAANGSYPKSEGFEGLHSQWGKDTAEWIPGLAPGFIEKLPLDPANSGTATSQYLYKSDQVDYKIIVHTSDDCKAATNAVPGLLDLTRQKDGNCWGYGYWTSGAADW